MRTGDESRRICRVCMDDSDHFSLHTCIVFDSCSVCNKIKKCVNCACDAPIRKKTKRTKK